MTIRERLHFVTNLFPARELEYLSKLIKICRQSYRLKFDVFEKLYFTVKKVAHTQQNLTSYKIKKDDSL